MPEDNNDQLKAIARLEVQLQTVLDRLTDVSSNMVTKDLYTAQNQSVEFRFSRVEHEVSQWRSESTAAHVELEAGSKARHEEAKRSAEVQIKALENRIDKADERAFQIEQAQDAQKNNKYLQYGLSGVGFILSIASAVVIGLLTSGIGPVG